MARYDIGSVVLVKWPWEEVDGSIQMKVRPAIVYRLESDQDRLTIQLTSKNRSAQFPGLWILKESKEGKEMGLLQDSFVNITYQREIHMRDIIRQIGTCHLIFDKIENLLGEND